MAELPPRPRPSRSPTDRLRDLVATGVERVRWFGAARAVGVALCVVAAAIGTFWLVRTPAPPIEASLPLATEATSSSVTASGAAPAPMATEVRDPSTPSPSSEPVEIVVHVAGEVALPGVYPLRAGARVVDALAAAGGPTGDADTDAVNLAEVLHDGDRVVVPSAADEVLVLPGVSGSGSGGASVSSPAGPLDLNRADAASLDGLPGIGPSTAAAIVAYRDEHGPFSSVDALADVRGIGPAKLEALRGLVTV